MGGEKGSPLKSKSYINEKKEKIKKGNEMIEHT
jgi:hypothetical protein